MIIYVLDNIGNTQFFLEENGIFNRFLNMTDNSVAVHLNPLQYRDVQTLYKINTTTGNFSEIITIPSSNSQIFAGNDTFELIISDNSNMYGYSVVFKGFPTVNRNGNALHAGDGISICAYSSNQEAAWMFVRKLLDKDWQYTNLWFGFPSNRVAFNRVIDDYNSKTQHEKATDEDIDKIINLINVASGVNWLSDDVLWNIISESALDYFKGVLSEQEAARIIQSKAMIYISENS